jgi:hypothetical protein
MTSTRPFSFLNVFDVLRPLSSRRAATWTSTLELLRRCFFGGGGSKSSSSSSSASTRDWESYRLALALDRLGLRVDCGAVAGRSLSSSPRLRISRSSRSRFSDLWKIYCQIEAMVETGARDSEVKTADEEARRIWAWAYLSELQLS